MKDESERIVETEHFLVSFIFEGPLSAHSKLRTKWNEENRKKICLTFSNKFNLQFAQKTSFFSSVCRQKNVKVQIALLINSTSC